MGCLGWFARMLWDRQEAQRQALDAEKDERNKAVSEVRVLIAGNYVSNAKLEGVIRDFKDDLLYIRDKLDGTPHRRQGDPTP